MYNVHRLLYWSEELILRNTLELFKHFIIELYAIDFFLNYTLRLQYL